MMPDDRLMIDFDHTDGRLRIWRGYEIVGELSPNQIQSCSTEEQIAAARWTGWMNSYAVVELFGSYAAETKRLEAADAL